jgi:DNA (cytosine-5)-methyltransferase 1
MEEDVNVIDSWEDYEDEDSEDIEEYMSEPESDEQKKEVPLTPEQEEMVKRLKIRKLVPEETFLLMGATIEDCQKCKDAGVSNSQLYKQAGKQNISA